jgi:phosphoglycolate phosphatase
MLFLVLWDIDGTLINSGGAGTRALRVALRNGFGINDLLDGIDYAGRTDRWIMRQIFAKVGLPATEENFIAYSDAYIEALPVEMSDPRTRVLPGIAVLLKEISQCDHIAQGLLTGNYQRSAKVKLGHHGIWDYFRFGAFADDAERRNDLGRHALRRARELHGVEFPPQSVWIVGDTPHDIECARAVGANSLAVATGLHSLEELAAHRPTALLGNLADTESFWHLTSMRPHPRSTVP